jgi:hypothetical protein
MPVSKRPRHKRNTSNNKMISRQMGAYNILALTSRAFPVIIKSQEDIESRQGQTFFLADVFVLTPEAVGMFLSSKGL